MEGAGEPGQPSLLFLPSQAQWGLGGGMQSGGGGHSADPWR